MQRSASHISLLSENLYGMQYLLRVDLVLVSYFASELVLLIDIGALSLLFIGIGAR